MRKIIQINFVYCVKCLSDLVLVLLIFLLLGFSHGGIQIQNFKSTGLVAFGSKNDVTLVHNASVYYTVIASNAVGKMAVSYSGRILVDLTPPLIPEVNDGRGKRKCLFGFFFLLLMLINDLLMNHQL